MRWNTPNTPVPGLITEQAGAEAERQAQQPGAAETASDAVAAGTDLLEIASSVVEGAVTVVGEVLGLLDL